MCELESGGFPPTPPLFFLSFWFWTRRASLRIQELRRAEGQPMRRVGPRDVQGGGRGRVRGLAHHTTAPFPNRDRDRSLRPGIQAVGFREPHCQVVLAAALCRRKLLVCHATHPDRFGHRGKLFCWIKDSGQRFDHPARHSVEPGVVHVSSPICGGLRPRRCGARPVVLHVSSALLPFPLSCLSLFSNLDRNQGEKKKGGVWGGTPILKLPSTPVQFFTTSSSLGLVSCMSCRLHHL